MAKSVDTDLPCLALVVIGRGDDLLRMQKRLRCAARALGLNLSLQIQRDDLAAAELGARRGPLLLAGDEILADGLLPVEALQARLTGLLVALRPADAAGSRDAG